MENNTTTAQNNTGGNQINGGQIVTTQPEVVQAEEFSVHTIDNQKVFASMVETARDLDSFVPVHEIKSQYKAFNTINEKVRGVFMGFCQIKDRRDQLITAVRWIDQERRVYHNAAHILVDDIRSFGIPPGTSIEIEYLGEKTTKSRNTVQKFSVFILKRPDKETGGGEAGN